MPLVSMHTNESLLSSFSDLFRIFVAGCRIGIKAVEFVLLNTTVAFLNFDGMAEIVVSRLKTLDGWCRL